MITKNIPPSREIFGNILFIFGKYFVAEPTNKAIKKNGMPSPREKTLNKIIPELKVAVEEASSKIVPKIGPMHGVQPKAKVAPKIKALIALPGCNLFRMFKRLVFCKKFKNGQCQISSINKPKRMMKAPPMRASKSR